jgi:hypothetical protein
MCWKIVLHYLIMWLHNPKNLTWSHWVELGFNDFELLQTFVNTLEKNKQSENIVKGMLWLISDGAHHH